MYKSSSLWWLISVVFPLYQLDLPNHDEFSVYLDQTMYAVLSIIGWMLMCFAIPTCYILFIKRENLYWSMGECFKSFMKRELYETYGLTKNMVRTRAILCSIKVGLPVLVGSYFEARGEAQINWHLILAFGGFIWAFHNAFISEFVGKYERLARIHDETLTKDDVSDVVEANFAEDCLSYHMQDHPDFRPTFEKIISGIPKEWKDSNGGCLWSHYPNISNYLTKQPNDEIKE